MYQQNYVASSSQKWLSGVETEDKILDKILIYKDNVVVSCFG